MGGILLICTMDIYQLLPIRGRPPIMSSHMLTSFVYSRLQDSMRAATDTNLQRIQKIICMLPHQFTDEVKTEFKELFKKTFSFASSFDDPALPRFATYVFGKKAPGMEIHDQMIQKLTQTCEFSCSESQDQEMTHHGNWIHASCNTSELLETKAKEPGSLYYFLGAIYRVTFNCPNRTFSQGQFAILPKLPTEDEKQCGRKKEVYVSPPGKKEFPDPTATLLQLRNEGWRSVRLGYAPARVFRLRANVKARRTQFGLKIYIATTAHACMGHTLTYLVTKVSMNEPAYRLWEKAMVVVILSRTRTGKHTFFVGDPEQTAEALDSKKKTSITDICKCFLKIMCPTPPPC